MSNILIVEDEPGIAFALESDLSTEGYEVTVVSDGGEAVTRALSGGFDLILLDVILPTKDGFEVCRELRCARVSTPIILLTARTQDTDKVVGLDLGADDYVTKPFSPRELRARIRAVLRRTEQDPGPDIHRFDDFELDLIRFELRRGGKPVDVTATELKLLAMLIENRGRVLTRDRLLDRVWGSSVHVTDRVVDNHIVSLRRKLDDDPTTPRYVMSVRGVGYRFDG